MDTGASQLDDLGARCFVRFKVKLLRTVVTKLASGVHSGLQTIGSNNLARRPMFDEQMIAYGIERIFVQPALIGLGQAFVEFQIEDFKAQGLRSANLFRAAREPCSVTGGGVDKQSD